MKSLYLFAWRKIAENILKENIDILHAMAEALIKYETIDKYQIDDLMARQPVREPQGWGDDSTPTSFPSIGDANSKDDKLGSLGEAAKQN